VNRLFDDFWHMPTLSSFGRNRDKVEATFKNGVLTVTLPKTASAQQKSKRIQVSSK